MAARGPAASWLILLVAIIACAEATRVLPTATGHNWRTLLLPRAQMAAAAGLARNTSETDGVRDWREGDNKFSPVQPGPGLEKQLLLQNLTTGELQQPQPIIIDIPPPEPKKFDKIPDLPAGPISDANCEHAGGVCSLTADSNCGEVNSLGICEDLQSYCCAVTVDEREDKVIVTGDAIETHPVVYHQTYEIRKVKTLIGKPYSRSTKLFDGTTRMIGKYFIQKGPERRWFMHPPGQDPTHYPTGFGKETGLPSNRWASVDDSKLNKPSGDEDLNSAPEPAPEAEPIPGPNASPVIRKPPKERWENYVDARKRMTFRWQRNIFGPQRAEPKHDLSRSGNPNGSGFGSDLDPPFGGDDEVTDEENALAMKEVVEMESPNPKVSHRYDKPKRKDPEDNHRRGRPHTPFWWRMRF